MKSSFQKTSVLLSTSKIVGDGSLKLLVLKGMKPSQSAWDPMTDFMLFSDEH